jgi:hypothetical protein
MSAAKYAENMSHAHGRWLVLGVRLDRILACVGMSRIPPSALGKSVYAVFFLASRHSCLNFRNSA